MQDGGVIQAQSKNDKVVCFVRAAGLLLGILWLPGFGLKTLTMISYLYTWDPAYSPKVMYIHEIVSNLVILLVMALVLFYLLRRGRCVILFLISQFEQYGETGTTERTALLFVRCLGLSQAGIILLSVVNSFFHFTGILSVMLATGFTNFVDLFQKIFGVKTVSMLALSFGVRLASFGLMIWIAWYLLMRGKLLAKLLLWKGKWGEQIV